MTQYEYNELTNTIIGCAIEVHRLLGPGMLESTYEQCLLYELRNAGLKVKSQQYQPIVYKTLRIENAYRTDILVEDCIVLELKTIDSFLDVHKAQLLSYMKLGEYKLGLLLNFRVKLLRSGIIRLVNDF